MPQGQNFYGLKQEAIKKTGRGSSLREVLARHRLGMLSRCVAGVENASSILVKVSIRNNCN